jgi:hypothetical protein
MPRPSTRTILLLLATLFLSGCGGTQAIGLPPPDPQPTLQVSAQTGSTAASRPNAIPADAVKQLPEDDPFAPVLHVEAWEPPVPLPAPVNTAGAEDSPFISPDGGTLVFFFTPDASIPAERQLHDGVTGLYISTRSGQAWDEPRRLTLQLPGEVSLDGCGFLQGEILWFCSARIGNRRAIDVWIATLSDGVPIQWVNAGERLNRELQIGEMHLSADGSVLYFHGRDAEGDVDLFRTTRQGDTWSAAEPLFTINSPETDGWPFVTQDGQELWFTRTYQGTPAIYRSLRAGNEWTEPELVLSSFAGEPTLDSAGNLYFVHHFIRDGVILDADIYVATRR